MAATQKINFLNQFPIHSLGQFLARTYRSPVATIQNVTDRGQTDRQTARPIVQWAKTNVFTNVFQLTTY